MKRTLALPTALALSAAVTSPYAQSAFKVYGFMDANYEATSYKDNNFLAGQGYLGQNQDFVVNHVNTYFDWKTNEKVRVLLELSLNRDPYKAVVADQVLAVDGQKLYDNLYAQFYGMMTQLYGVPAQTAQVLAADSAAKYRAVVSQSVDGMKVGSGSTSTKDHGIDIPRVHADLAINDLFNLRVGKWITPSGIWNVDHGSPSILTVSQPNQTAFIPVFPVSQTGVQAFGRTYIGDHDLSYASWISTGRGSATTGGSDYAQSPKNWDDWALGTHLQGDLSVAGAAWRIGTTVHTGTDRHENSVTKVPVVGYDLTKASNPSAAILTGGLEEMTTSATDVSYSREWTYGLDTKLKMKGLVLQGEWNHRKVINLMKKSGKVSDINAWYGLIAYEIPLGADFNVTPYYMHERIEWSDMQNNPALGLDGFPMDGWSLDQFGLNFGLWSSVHLKLEWTHNIIEPVKIARPSVYYNNLTEDDLAVERYAAQISVAY